MVQTEENKIMQKVLMTAVFVSFVAGVSIGTLYGQDVFQPKMEVTGLTAIYPLSSDGNDILGKSKPMELKRTEFENGAIYSDGRYAVNEGNTYFNVDMTMKVFAIRAEFKVPEMVTDEYFPVPVFVFLDRWMGVGLDKDGTVTLIYDNTEKQVKSNARYQVNVWHELILTYDEVRRQSNVYFDGKLISTLNNTPKRSYNLVGLTNYATGRVFKGWLRNISIGTGVRAANPSGGNMNQTGGNNRNPSGSPEIEDQYWDAVKLSTQLADFQSYLREYPNGKYVAIARLKVNQLGGVSLPNTPINQNQAKLPVSAKLSLQSDRIPMSRNDPAYTVQKLDILPAILLDVTFSDGSKAGPYDYKKNFASNVVFDDQSGDPNDLIRVSYWDVDSNNPQRGKYAAQLTSTGNGTGTAYLKVSFRNAPNVTAAVQVNVVSGKTMTVSRQTNAQYLESRAAEVRAGLPQMVGNFQMTNSFALCPAGCQVTTTLTYLLLQFNATGNQQNMPIAEVERSLKPILLQQYCQSETRSRNLILGVVFSNRGPNADFNNFWVYPKDCP